MSAASAARGQGARRAHRHLRSAAAWAALLQVSGGALCSPFARAVRRWLLACACLARCECHARAGVA